MASRLININQGDHLSTRLENLEMSGNLTAVREMSGIILKIGEISEKCEGKVA